MPRIAWTKRAEKEGGRLPQDVRQRIVHALERYAAEQHGDVRKVRNAEPKQWRLRVGDYRVRFRLRGDVLEVLHVGHRRDVYRR